MKLIVIIKVADIRPFLNFYVTRQIFKFFEMQTEKKDMAQEIFCHQVKYSVKN